jgi:hypothetical protein
MISVSSIPIHTSISSEEFHSRFQDINNIAPIFECKPVRHLKVTENKLSFILKRVAQFELSASKNTGDSWVQFDSTKAMLFKSAIRFSLNIENQEINIDFETDTNVFMELFLEKRLIKLLEHLSRNINLQLN